MTNDVYYSAKEARELLGMTHSALLNQVTIGNLHRIIPPGKRQGVYLRSEVDQLKREIESFLATRQETNPTPTQFHRANLDHLTEAYHVAEAIFDEKNVAPLEREVEWWEKNSDIDWVLNQNGEIVGFIQLLPLTQKTAQKLISGEQQVKDLTADDIVSYNPGVSVSLYGTGIGSQPSVSLAQKRRWGQRLIKGAYDIIMYLADKGVTIEEIRAQSSKPDCIRMLRHMGFLETQSHTPGVRSFLMPIEQSGAPWVMEYKKALADYQSRNVDTSFDTNTSNNGRTPTDG